MPITVLLLIGLILVLFSYIEDIKYYRLFYSGTSVSKYRLVFFPFFFLFLLYVVNILPGLLPLIAIVVICYSNYLHRNHLVGFILESHYTSNIALLLLSLSSGSYLATIIFSSSILISSISAGMAKLTDPLWTTNPIGLQLFLALPWRIRPFIVGFHIHLLSFSPLYKSFLFLATRITPYAQIVSAVLLLLSVFVSHTAPSFTYSVFLFPLIFQLLFAFLLLAFAGLGLIPYLYSFGIVIFAFFTFNISHLHPEFSIFDPSSIFSVVYIIIYICGCFRLLDKFSPKLSFLLRPLVPSGPHYMFTEYNLDGMIAFSVRDHQSIQIPFVNPFDRRGVKSKAQNLYSDKFFCLFYLLMDFVYLHYSSNGQMVADSALLMHSTSSRLMKKICRLFKYIDCAEFNFIQFNWSDSSSSYLPVPIGSIVLGDSGNIQGSNLAACVKPSLRLRLLSR